jgi:hypothetical protein
MLETSSFVLGLRVIPLLCGVLYLLAFALSRPKAGAPAIARSS